MAEETTGTSDKGAATAAAGEAPALTEAAAAVEEVG